MYTIRFKPIISKPLKIPIGKLRQEMKSYLVSNLKEVRNKTWIYPPPPPASKYIRTGKLRRGWDLQSAMDAELILVELTNDVRYATYVHGLEQVDYHKLAGWRVLYSYIDEKQIVRDLQKIVDGGI